MHAVCYRHTIDLVTSGNAWYTFSPRCDALQSFRMFVNALVDSLHVFTLHLIVTF